MRATAKLRGPSATPASMMPCDCPGVRPRRLIPATRAQSIGSLSPKRWTAKAGCTMTFALRITIRSRRHWYGPGKFTRYNLVALWRHLPQLLLPQVCLPLSSSFQSTLNPIRLSTSPRPNCQTGASDAATAGSVTQFIAPPHSASASARAAKLPSCQDRLSARAALKSKHHRGNGQQRPQDYLAGAVHYNAAGPAQNRERCGSTKTIERSWL